MEGIEVDAKHIVSGRPTLEKCQKVKAEREIKAEVESLDTENIIESSSRRATRSQGPKRKRRVIESDEEDEEEGPGQKVADLNRVETQQKY